MPIELYFDGYCPESLLKGKQVEMRLNRDDFWESEATGLQMAVFPPYATILKWRGKGDFKQSSPMASDSIVGMVMSGASDGVRMESLPDESNLIKNEFDLLWYLDGIYDSKEEFQKYRFNPNDPVFEVQYKHLQSLNKEDWVTLLSTYDALWRGKKKEITNCDAFDRFYKNLYDIGLIFSFNWQNWKQGWKNLDNPQFDFSSATLLELSMYLTAIFRAERFNDGTIDTFFEKGVIPSIFSQLKEKQAAKEA